jgi:hypothetical protein
MEEQLDLFSAVTRDRSGQKFKALPAPKIRKEIKSIYTLIKKRNPDVNLIDSAIQNLKRQLAVAKDISPTISQEFKELETYYNRQLGQKSMDFSGQVTMFNDLDGSGQGRLF